MLDPLSVVIQPAEHLGAVRPENMFHRFGVAYQDIGDDERSPHRIGPSMALQVRELRDQHAHRALGRRVFHHCTADADRRRGQRAAMVAAGDYRLSKSLITLAMLNKIQIVFLICALPILVLPHSRPCSQRSLAA